MRTRSSANGARAVVIGGSIAGMCAARALHDHFEEVVVLERDVLPTQPSHRPGAPQSQHVHALLLRGLLELERLFPGIERELLARGAARMDLGFDFAHYTDWGWAPRERVGVEPLTVSRLLLENVVRDRLVRESSRLTVLEGVRATGLLTERKGAHVQVTGVTTSQEHGALRADLVVDASGRHSKCFDWLAAVQVERPEEERVDAFAGYASRFYELVPDTARWWRGILIDPKAPDHKRWGLLMPVEDNRVVLTLGGLNHDYPPGDERGFQAFLDSLRTPELSRAIAAARPVSPIHTHRALYNRARHLERWRSKVAGFLAIGDSAVAFNAYHGQGMSMAALSATTLADACSKGADPSTQGFAARFHRQQWRRLKTAWDMATGMDLEWPETEGERPRGYRFLFDLSVLIVRAAHDDPALKRYLGPVFQLVAPPTALLRPSVVARVLLATWKRWLGRTRLTVDMPTLPDRGTP